MNANGKIIDVIETKDADNFNYTQTQIILYKDTEEVNSVAQQIQKVLGVGLIKSSDENPENISISIILVKTILQSEVVIIRKIEMIGLSSELTDGLKLDKKNTKDMVKLAARIADSKGADYINILEMKTPYYH